MEQLRREYRKELEEREDAVLGMGRRAQQLVGRAMEALQSEDPALVAEVVAADDRIDVDAQASEEAIVKLIGLQAPVATELRLLTALLHVNRHLERIGDYAVNIARLAVEEHEGIPAPDLAEQIGEMGSRAMTAVGAGLDAFGRRDAAGVERVELLEDPIDLLFEGLHRRLVHHGGVGEPQLRWSMRMLLVSRHLERIGDHAVGVAEQGAYVATGRRRPPPGQRD